MFAARAYCPWVPFLANALFCAGASMMYAAVPVCAVWHVYCITSTLYLLVALLVVSIPKLS